MVRVDDRANIAYAAASARNVRRGVVSPEVLMRSGCASLYSQCLSQPPMRRAVYRCRRSACLSCIDVVAVVAAAADAVLSSQWLPPPLMPC